MSPRPRSNRRKDLPPYFRARRSGRGYYLEHPITRECATLGDDKAQALALYWQLRPEIDAAVAAHRDGVRAAAIVRVIEARPRGETLRAFLCRWRTDVLPTLVKRGSRAGLGAKTRGDYERMLRNQLEPLEGAAIELARADAQALRALLSPWLEQPHTYNYLRAVLTRALQHAVDAGVLGTNPMRSIEPRAKPRRDAYVTDSDYVAITDGMTEYARRACDLLYLLATRPSDGLGLRVGSLVTTDAGTSIRFRAAKNGEEQELTGNPALAEVLEWWRVWRSEHAPLSPYLLVHPRTAHRKLASRPITTDWLSRQFAAAAAKATLPYTLRDLRPKSITDEHLAGNDDNKGGHTEAMRRRYTRVRLPTRAAVTIQLPKRNQA